MYILNTERFLCDIRGLRYIQNKIWFWNRWVHIHSDLKCSSQHQNDFEIPRLTSDWPDHTMRGPKGLKLVFQGFPGTDRGMSVYLGANLALLRPLLVIPNMNLSIQNPILFCKYLSPLISHINGSVFRIYIYGSQFSEEKNGQEICFLVSEILSKYKRSIFFGMPCTITIPIPILVSVSVWYRYRYLVSVEH